MFQTIESIDQFVILLNTHTENIQVFELLLKVVCRAMSQDEEVNVDEKCKLTTLLNLDMKAIDVINSTLISIVMECVYYVAKPNLVLQVSNKIGCLLKEMG